jgi:hypothetical protein
MPYELNVTIKRLVSSVNSFYLAIIRNVTFS